MSDGFLHGDWQALAHDLGSPPRATRWGDWLLDAWRRPGRHYHTLEHLEHVLRLLHAWQAESRDWPALRLAAWFHDAVYDPRAGDNEEQSAASARECGADLGLTTSRTDEITRLILLTKSHQAAESDIDGQLLLDADLSILGSPPDRYDRYAADIRREYAWVPEEQYVAGRGQVLRRFLERPRLFQCERAFLTFEARARDNLRRELANLGVAP